MDVERELEDSIGLLNGVSALNMHKMGFTKVDNTWVTKNDVVANVGVGAHDNEVGSSFMNQVEKDTSELVSQWKDGSPPAPWTQCVQKWASHILQCKVSRPCVVLTMYKILQEMYYIYTQS